MTLIITPDTIPGLLPQLIIWLLYAFTFVLVFNALKKSKKQKDLSFKYPAKFSYKLFAGLGLLFAISSALTKAFLAGFSLVIIVGLVWFGGGLFGMFILYKTIRYAI